MILKNNNRIDGCSDTVPIGTLNPYLGSTAPYGYLICAGQLVSKTIYPELYSICGSLFGTETSTEFYLPDLRGQTIAGYKENDAVFGTLGGLVGNLTHTHTTQAHTLTVNEIPSHNHETSQTYTAGGDGKNFDVGIIKSDRVSTAGNYWWNWTANAGGGQAHEHGDTGSTSSVQPTMTLNWIVKAFQLMPNQSYVATSRQDSDTNTYSCTYINNTLSDAVSDVYSLTETKTNKIWVDGKPIYRKVVVGNTSYGAVLHNLENVTFVNAYGYYTDSNGVFYPLTLVRPSNSRLFVGFFVNDTQVVIDKGASASSGTAYITLEYTKNS